APSIDSVPTHCSGRAWSGTESPSRRSVAGPADPVRGLRRPEPRPPRPGLHLRQPLGRQTDRRHHALVAGTPAEVAADVLANLRLGWIGNLAKERLCSQQQPRRTEPALQSVRLMKG